MWQHLMHGRADVQVVALFIVMAFKESDVVKDKRLGVKSE
jgi:hypothetical protein